MRTVPSGLRKEHMKTSFSYLLYSNVCLSRISHREEKLTVKICHHSSSGPHTEPGRNIQYFLLEYQVMVGQNMASATWLALPFHAPRCCSCQRPYFVALHIFIDGTGRQKLLPATGAMVGKPDWRATASHAKPECCQGPRKSTWGERRRRIVFSRAGGAGQAITCQVNEIAAR